jgi:hypothetical protein
LLFGSYDFYPEPSPDAAHALKAALGAQKPARKASSAGESVMTKIWGRLWQAVGAHEPAAYDRRFNGQHRHQRQKQSALRKTRPLQCGRWPPEQQAARLRGWPRNTFHTHQSRSIML